MADLVYGENNLDQPKKRTKQPSNTSGQSYTDMSDNENVTNWEVAANQFSQNSDTSGEGPDGHHKELDVTITDILDRGDPRQPMPEEKKKPVRKTKEDCLN